MILNKHSTGETFGYITSFINTILFIPQVHLIYKTKDTTSISYTYLSLEIISSLMSLGYGVLIKEYPIIISSSSILCCTSLIFYGKVFFPKKEIINNQPYHTFD